MKTRGSPRNSPIVGIVIGSTSDWETMKAAAKVLESFGLPYEAKAMSAHRTPKAVAAWAGGAAKNGIKVIIAAAGGAAGSLSSGMENPEGVFTQTTGRI